MYRRLLVPVDGSEPAHAGEHEARAFARAYGAKLLLLHVIDDAPIVDDLWAPADAERFLLRQRRHARALLNAAQLLCAHAGLTAESHLFELQRGGLARAIVQQAEALDCDLIVLGSHGRRGVRRAVLGSDAEGVLREAAMPVMVVRDGAGATLRLPVEERLPYRRLLVPVDGSAPSAAGLDAAIRLAQAADGRLRLVHLVDELSVALAFDPLMTTRDTTLQLLRAGGAALLEQAARTARAAGVDAEITMVEGLAQRLGDVVAEQAAAWTADLVVVGSHGRRGVDRALLGSGAEQILRRAPVPVLVIPAGR